MLYGGDKTLMLQNSEKQVFFTPDVHTTRKNTNIPFYGEVIDEQEESEDSE
jgi:hypothetical protein